MHLGYEGAFAFLNRSRVQTDAEQQARGKKDPQECVPAADAVMIPAAKDDTAPAKALPTVI